jgi:hypothetical protein
VDGTILWTMCVVYCNYYVIWQYGAITASERLVH